MNCRVLRKGGGPDQNIDCCISLLQAFFLKIYQLEKTITINQDKRQIYKTKQTQKLSQQENEIHSKPIISITTNNHPTEVFDYILKTMQTFEGFEQRFRERIRKMKITTKYKKPKQKIFWEKLNWKHILETMKLIKTLKNSTGNWELKKVHHNVNTFCKEITYEKKNFKMKKIAIKIIWQKKRKRL